MKSEKFKKSDKKSENKGSKKAKKESSARESDNEESEKEAKSEKLKKSEKKSDKKSEKKVIKKFKKHATSEESIAVMRVILRRKVRKVSGERETVVSDEGRKHCCPKSMMELRLLLCSLHNLNPVQSTTAEKDKATHQHVCLKGNA